MNPIKILICDDDIILQKHLKQVLQSRYECLTAAHGDQALEILKQQVIDVLILDVHLRNPKEGIQYIPKFLNLDPDLSIVMNSSASDFKTVKEALKLGAYDYMIKNSEEDALFHTVEQAIQRRQLEQRQKQHASEIARHQKLHVMVGDSPSIRQLRKSIEKLKNSSANILITGETGTGKEVVARLLRRDLPTGAPAPFIAVDSSTIQSSMAESILFGHEKGAFTGADRSNKGIFEEANGGTVYFDEISNMPMGIQAKLLRVLQEKEITRVGSTRVIQLDFRVICASNKDLEKMSAEGEFKEDLYQRLNVIPIHLPPLRERKEDIPALVDHFVQKHRGQKEKITFTQDALETLKLYSWPGNIRELGNVIDYLLTLIETPEVNEADLPPKLRDAARKAAHQPAKAQTPSKAGASFYERVAEFEAQVLTQEYQNHKGNISQLALALEMDRSHLYTKLKEYQIHQSRRS